MISPRLPSPFRTNGASHAAALRSDRHGAFKRMATASLPQTSRWGRLTASCTVLLLIAAIPQAGAQLVHRYSFTTNANDSVGSAHASVVDAGTTSNAVFSGGMLDLSANAGNPSNAITEDAYVNLPNGVVSAAAAGGMDGAVAFEWWFTVSENRTWQRVGDFGNSNDGEDTSNLGSASPYLSIVATSGRGNIVDMTNHTTTGAEPAAGFGGAPVVGQQYHVMAVYNHNDARAFTPAGANGTMTLYFHDGINPVQIAYGAIHPDMDLRTLDDVNNWLGRSQWPDPLFDGLYNEFRIYNAAPSGAYVASSFAAGPDAVAPFQAWTPEFDLSLQVDRDAGTFTLNNAGPAIDVVGISISSASGALDPAKWKSVADNYDSDSGATFDNDNTWTVSSSVPTQLTEVEVVGDGGQLGTGGTQTSLALGLADAWTLSRFEDLVVSIDRLLPDFSLETIPVRVEYINGIGQTAGRSDLNFDGAVTAADWVAFASHHLQDLSAMTVAQAAAAGDLDGNRTNDYDDFLLFQTDYDAVNGSGALAALLAVPEPSAAALLLSAGLAAIVCRRKGSVSPQ